MLYFFSSTNKRDKIKNPITISTTSEKKAHFMAVIMFKKYNYIGSPKLIKI